MDIKLEETAQKISNLEIQGATAVAVALSDSIKSYADRIKGDVEQLKIGISQAASYLATARPTEPMARNAAKYIVSGIQGLVSTEEIKTEVRTRCDKYIQFIEEAKPSIIQAGKSVLSNYRTLFSHCHASTSRYTESTPTLQLLLQKLVHYTKAELPPPI
jgi:translation initiation factor 2B subunit (eIF-2B alpha/beta/delta family)